MLYLLMRAEKPGWDEATGFVIGADTEAEARALAATRAGDERADAWLVRAIVHPIKGDEKGIILEAFLNS